MKTTVSQFLAGYLIEAKKVTGDSFENSQFLAGYLEEVAPPRVEAELVSQFLAGYLTAVLLAAALLVLTLNSLLDT